MSLGPISMLICALTVTTAFPVSPRDDTFYIWGEGVQTLLAKQFMNISAILHTRHMWTARDIIGSLGEAIVRNTHNVCLGQDHLEQEIQCRDTTLVKIEQKLDQTLRRIQRAAG